jgi:predicted RNA-binding protein YlxR (DUF448 family)
MQRSCASCRTSRDTARLIRLGVCDGLLLPSRNGGRGLWICKSPVCIARLEKSPKLARRALRQQVDPAGLGGRIAAWLQEVVGGQLCAAKREGCIRNLDRTFDRHQLGLVVSAENRQEASPHIPMGIPNHTIQVTTNQLEAWIGKNPSGSVGVIPSHLLQSLDENLRLWVGLR